MAGAVGAHAAGVRAGVAVTHPLEVLRRQQRDHGCAVADAEDAGLGPVEVLLKKHPAASCETCPAMLQCRFPVVSDDHTFAAGQTVILTT